jgi:hypothetical protein
LDRSLIFLLFRFRRRIRFFLHFALMMSQRLGGDEKLSICSCGLESVRDKTKQTDKMKGFFALCALSVAVLAVTVVSQEPDSDVAHHRSKRSPYDPTLPLILGKTFLLGSVLGPKLFGKGWGGPKITYGWGWAPRHSGWGWSSPVVHVSHGWGWH